MIHVVCSKWGTKYSPEYVNRLYLMVKKYLPTKFKFYCQTDDMSGIYSQIIQIPFSLELPESSPDEMINSSDYINGLPRLWDRPKLNYFNPNFIDRNDIKIALDLDLIIHNDMKPILDLFKDKPITGRSWWHDMNQEKEPAWRKRYGARNNGGFYMWQGDAFKEIWLDLKKNWKKVYFVFHGGSDNFITTRHLDKFDFLPPSMFYSFNRGCSWPDDIVRHKIREDKIICVFNTDPGNATNFELHEAVHSYSHLEKLWKLEQ